MREERKWMSCELEKEEWEKFRPELKKAGIKYQASDCYNLIHIDTFINQEEAKTLDNIIDTIITD